MGSAKGNGRTVAGEIIAAEPLTERSANEKGTLNKKFGDWLLLND